MKLGLIHVSVTFAAAAAALSTTAGCSSSTGNPLNQPPNQTNHALGVVSVGETHVSGSGSFEPEIDAAFIANVAELATCTTTISGCTILTPAVCNGATGPECTPDQTCVLDVNCKPTCQTNCTATCPTGEECFFPTPSTQSCQPIQSFDAGDLILTGPGIATTVTLTPPSYFPEQAGLSNPLVWGQQITVTSSGATGAGFQSFNETVKATTLLQTSPSISTLTAANVFSPLGLALGWTPGNDSVVISVTGPQGTANCPATDSTGLFTVPAQVVSAIAGGGSPAISISVTREHTEVKTDAKTQGTLANETVEPVGYLDLSTTSTETTTVEGCGAGSTMCADGCDDLLTSNVDCGTCGHSCGTGICESGVCTTTTTCPTGYTTCNGECVSLETSGTNCGECGFVCPAGDSCETGECIAATTCPTGYTQCADGCQDLEISSTDCGLCENACAAGTSCVSGECTTATTTCASCESTVETSTCASQYTACEDDTNCTNFATCASDCTAGDTVCLETCAEDYPTGATEDENLQTCICDTACESSCSADPYCTTQL
jgi:hypothetical protein